MHEYFYRNFVKVLSLFEALPDANDWFVVLVDCKAFSIAVN